MSVYTLKDTITHQSFDISIYNGELYWSASTNTPSLNPIVLDMGDNKTLWQITISNGLIGWSVIPYGALTPIVRLLDNYSYLYYDLAISFGNLEWIAESSIGGSSGPLNPNDINRIFKEE